MRTADSRHDSRYDQPPPRWANVIAVALVAAAAVAVFVYELTRRLEPIVLALIAVSGIAFIVAIVAIAALVVVIFKKNGKQQQQQPQPYSMQPPIVMMTPPVAYPQIPQQQQYPPQVSNVRQRQYTIVGDGDEFG